MMQLIQVKACTVHLVQLQTSLEHLKRPPDLERVVPAVFRCLSEEEEDDEGKEDDKGKVGEVSRQDEDALDNERR